MNTAPQPAPVPPLPSKQGIPVLGWVGIGCGSLLLVGIVLGAIAFGFFVKKIKGYTNHPEKIGAEMMVRMHPDLEIIDQNDEKGAMIIKVKGGETLTARYNEIIEGKFSYKDAQGNVVRLGGESDLSAIPSWVPKATNLTVTQSSRNILNGKAAGSYAGTSTDSPDTMENWFKDEAPKLGLSLSNSTTTPDGKGQHHLTFSDSTREVVVRIINMNRFGCSLDVSYREK